jgi:hypothetical protein
LNIPTPPHGQAEGVVARDIVSAPIADLVALRQLQTYQAGELARIQKRADKWIAGLVAITGVLTTAVVVKGAESFVDLVDSRTVLGIPLPPQDLIILLMLAGGAAIGFGVVKAYSAAYGDPLKEDALAKFAGTQEVDGAWAAWTTATANAAADARSALRTATIATVAGVFALALAVLLTWTTPEVADTGTQTCLSVDGQVVKLRGTAPTVTEGELTLVPC